MCSSPLHYNDLSYISYSPIQAPTFTVETEMPTVLSTPTAAPTANVANDFISNIDDELYSNLFLRYLILAVAVIAGAMILFYVFAAFYDICACHTCPSLSWIVGLERRGYTAVRGVEVDNPINKNTQSQEVINDDEEKATKLKAADFSADTISQFEKRFAALEMSLEFEKQKRIDRELELDRVKTQLDSTRNELNSTKEMYASLDEEIRVIKETGSGRSTPRGISPSAKRTSGGSPSPESGKRRQSTMGRIQGRANELFTPPTLVGRYNDDSSVLSEFTADTKSESKTVVTVLEHPDGIYEGETVDGLACGKGIKKYSGKWTGQVYEGSWRNNRSHGHGSLTWPSGAVYTGDWINGKIEGKGTYFFADGAKYEGDMKDGKSHGVGKYVYVDGRTYEGQFENDKQHGFGTYRSKEGTVLYNGQYKYGKRVV